MSELRRMLVFMSWHVYVVKSEPLNDFATTGFFLLAPSYCEIHPPGPWLKVRVYSCLIKLFFFFLDCKANFMELSPSWEATSCAATQELPKILWNLKVHYHVHKSLPWALCWARSIQSISPHPISLKSILILDIHLTYWSS
jgi:hypothetical protein